MTDRGHGGSVPNSVSAADETTALLAASDDVSGSHLDNSIVPSTKRDDGRSHITPNGNIDGSNSHDDHGDDNEDINQSDQDDKPLPRLQIFLLCYARLVEPVAFFSIFPFINQMIWETGDIAESDVGFYSGLIESLFSLTQMALMIPWGRAADKLGRKPVLVFSLFGITIATSLFGLSKTIWQMILFRCFAGIFAGTVVTIRTMMSENSTAKTQARAFSFYAFAGNIGIFLGPLIGGALSNPSKEYPAIFGGIQFFQNYPYALPTFVTGAFGATAAVISALFIKETKLKLTTNTSSSDPESPSSSAAAAADTEILSTWQIISSPGVKMVLYLYGHVMLLAFAYTAVIPVFWFTHPRLGGYGFTPLQISLSMVATGFSQALWLLLIFPPLQKRVGTGGVIRACGIAYPFFFLAFPVGNFLLKQHWIVAFWIVFAPALVLGTGVSMAFTAVQLALNDISPSPATLGTLNAIALTLVTGIRAVSPALFTSIYATGVRLQILDGYLVWVVMVALAVGYAFAARYLPEKAEGGGRKKKK